MLLPPQVITSIKPHAKISTFSCDTSVQKGNHTCKIKDNVSSGHKVKTLKFQSFTANNKKLIEENLNTTGTDQTDPRSSNVCS